MDGTQHSVIRDVTEADFATDVVEASRRRPVVVDFWAGWCGPCHQLSPILERVAARFADDVELVKVDVDAAPGLAQRYGVQGIPAVKAFRDGRVVAEFVGVQPEQQVERFFTALAPSEADRLVTAAAEPGADREGLLRQALDADPGHVGAVIALSELLVSRGEEAEARTLLERVPHDAEARRLLARLNLAEPAGAAAEETVELRAEADAGDAAAALALGRALAAREAYDEALPYLVAAVRDAGTREDARERVLEVFAVLGDEHPLVRSWRPKLAAALF